MEFGKAAWGELTGYTLNTPRFHDHPRLNKPSQNSIKRNFEIIALVNKTISDGGITVDFSIAEVHTFN